MIQRLDYRGNDESEIGEHHSAGRELIASPLLVIAAAAEKTKHIKLGSGVLSLRYHHPFVVAQCWVQLDRMTRGRAMLGCGLGALTSGGYVLEHSTVGPTATDAGGDGRDHATFGTTVPEDFKSRIIGWRDVT